MFRSTVIPFCRAYWDLDNSSEKQLPPGPCFIYGNHSNNYDPFILNAFTRLGRATAGVMTMEYLESGPLAPIFTAIGIEGTRKRVPEPHLIRKIWRLLDQGRRVIIFPEGGRRWDGRPAPWIESTAKLFMKARVPVYPIEIIGSYVAWPRWAPWPRPARVRVKIHDAVDFSDDPSLDMALRRLKMPISSDENIVAESIRPKRAFHPAAGIERLLYRDPSTGEFGGLEVVSRDTLESKSSGLQWRVNPDSTLTETHTGQMVTSAELYSQIRDLPLSRSSGATLVSNFADVRVEIEGIPRLIEKRQRCSVFEDHIRLGDSHLEELENILYMGLEKSDKIWLLTAGAKITARFRYGGSVLAWQDVLNRIAPHINT